MEKSNQHIVAIDFILAVMVLLAFVVGVGNRGVNCDLFLGLASGRAALQGALNQPDQWSFTAAGTIWVDQSWLSNVVYYVSYAGLGYAGPVLLKIALLAGCCVILLSRCRRLGVSRPVALLALSGGLLASAPFLTIRGESFGVFYFLLLTVFLAEADRNKVIRRFGIPLLLLVWSNSHGSFMLGLGLLGIKTGLVFIRRVSRLGEPWSDKPSWGRATEWLLVSIISVVLATFVNPFGTRNILMPFTQVGTSVVTGYSADWLPLFSPGDIGWIFGPGSVHSYLVFVLGTLACVVLLFLFQEATARVTAAKSVGDRPGLIRAEQVNEVGRSTAGNREKNWLSAWLSGLRTDWIMEIVTAVIVTALAFHFRRLILLAGLALVPITAVVLERVKGRVLEFLESMGGIRKLAACLPYGALIASMLLTVGTGWLCYRLAILPYAPENPMIPERPLMRKLMSYDTFPPQLVSFMEQNRIRGRVLSGWQISSYLLYRVQGIELFMDTRDQSFYPREVIRDYFAIMGLLHESEPDRMRLLDKYSVDLVVMTTEPYDFKLALTLAKNSAWGCVYYDDYSIVLVRTESPRFHDMLNEVNFRNLWYPDEDTRIRSEALHAHSKHIQVPPYLIDKLKLIVERHPRPNLYRLISWGEGYPRGCLQEATTRFLLSEAARLSGISPLYAHGAEEITQSLMAIWEILATSAQNCGNENARMKFEQLRQRCASEFEVMSRKYLGPPF